VLRYFYHFSDGKRTFTDSHGVELIGIAAIRANAVAQIRELRSLLSEHGIQDWAAWKIIVADAKGQTVFEIGFDLKPTE
jgi:hypothetical protein